MYCCAFRLFQNDVSCFPKQDITSAKELTIVCVYAHPFKGQNSEVKYLIFEANFVSGSWCQVVAVGGQCVSIKSAPALASGKNLFSCLKLVLCFLICGCGLVFVITFFSMNGQTV